MLQRGCDTPKGLTSGRGAISDSAVPRFRHVLPHSNATQVVLFI